MRKTLMKAGQSIALATMALVGGYLLHRQGRRWGATDLEAHESLPGDEAVPHPAVETTHAVTIHAPTVEVWPWLVQMGYGRAGWYTDALWYRLVDRYLWRNETVRTARIAPEWQRLAVGDIVPDGPPDTAYFTVSELEPNHTLVLYSTTHGTVWLPSALRDNPNLGIHCEFSWAFILREITSEQTRLILRTRVAGGPALYNALTAILLPPADFFMARMMLLRIRQRVEASAAMRRRGGQVRQAPQIPASDVTRV